MITWTIPGILVLRALTRSPRDVAITEGGQPVAPSRHAAAGRRRAGEQAGRQAVRSHGRWVQESMPKVIQPASPRIAYTVLRVSFPCAPLHHARSGNGRKRARPGTGRLGRDHRHTVNHTVPNVWNRCARAHCTYPNPQFHCAHDMEWDGAGCTPVPYALVRCCPHAPHKTEIATVSSTCRTLCHAPLTCPRRSACSTWAAAASGRHRPHRQ